MHKNQEEVQTEPLHQESVAPEPALKAPASSPVEEKPVSAAKKIWWYLNSKWRRFSLWVFNPSRLLRLLLLILFVAFAALVALKRSWLDWLPFASLVSAKAELKDVDWVATTTIYFAVSGWLVNAIVTIRNSVKQHTINTLLQSRLSKTYMDEADKAREALKDYAPDKVAPLNHIKDHDDRNSVDYILNYIEFIAVGMRHGDLHEGVMKDSMRGIVTGFAHVTSEYIQFKRRKPGSRTFENLLWLYGRWKD